MNPHPKSITPFKELVILASGLLIGWVLLTLEEPRASVFPSWKLIGAVLINLSLAIFWFMRTIRLSPRYNSWGKAYLMVYLFAILMFLLMGFIVIGDFVWQYTFKNEVQETLLNY